MKKSLSLFLALLIAGLLNPLSALYLTQAAAAATQTQEMQASATLTNQDVLGMLKAGIGEEIIVAKIKSSPHRFDTSPAALQELKSAGVSDAVVLAMVQAPAGGASAAVDAPAATMSQPGAMVEVNIPDGTPVEVELVSTASGQDLKVGDAVDFKVVQPVQVNGVTIIEKEAPAKARITKAKKSGHWGRAGKLEWAMQETIGVDGSRIPLRFTKSTAGDSKGGTVAVGAVATTVLLGPLGLLWGLKSGKPAIIPAGNRYSVFVHGNVAAKGRAAATPATSSNTQ
jgi:hypothetical protein